EFCRAGYQTVRKQKLIIVGGEQCHENCVLNATAKERSHVLPSGSIFRARSAHSSQSLTEVFAIVFLPVQKGGSRPSAPPGRQLIFHDSSTGPHAAPFIAALTLSGVKGPERSRTPIASNTALEIADGTTAAAGSPAPHGRSLGRSIRSITISGTSGNFRIG